MPTYTSPFTGDIVEPTDVSFYALTFSTNQVLNWPNYIVPGSTEVAAARIMNCTATTSGLSISLPPADQGSVGTDILFRNLGAETFTIEDYVGGQSVSLAAGEARYFYLTDNTSTAGVWNNFTYGTGTSSADAASLAGDGLATLVGKLITSTEVVRTSNNIAFNETDRALAYVWIGGAGTADLPPQNSLTSGWFAMLRNSGSGSLTLTAPAGKTVNGAATQTFYPSDSAIIVYDINTGNFFTVGLTRQTQVTYSAATYDVDNIVGNTLNLVNYAPTIQTYVALSGTRTQNLDVTLPAITQIYIISNETGQTGYDITFEVTGTTSAPLTVPTGSITILLTSGLEIYPLIQTSTSIFFAVDGSLGSPSFTFLNDTGSGMFLNTTNNPQLVSNGLVMLNMDATNPLDPQVDVPAQFNADLISGGTY